MTDRRSPDIAELEVGAMVLAAGGVVLDRTDVPDRVLVVHRPGYDDWTLPKGHVDPGERIAAAALREVLEETGVPARIVRPGGTTEHAVQVGARTAIKQVHWFVMEPLDSTDPATRPSDSEVDRSEWWSTATALDELTHAGERALLASILTNP
jgi:8-oxo-dGTP pyrophosphatase MutT (NUDIX family)